MDSDAVLARPQPPRKEISGLLRRYPGPLQRAGQGVVIAGTREHEDAICKAAGFSGPERMEVPGWSWSAPPTRSSRRSPPCPARPPTCSVTASD
jgi:hypothetical protein